MNRDNTILTVLALSTVIGVGSAIIRYRLWHRMPAKRTESTQDASLPVEGYSVTMRASDGFGVGRGFESNRLDADVLLTGYGLSVSRGSGDFANFTNPNDYVVKWSLPNGTWTAHWTKD